MGRSSGEFPFTVVFSIGGVWNVDYREVLVQPAETPFPRNLHGGFIKKFFECKL
jgi:hypothetical protein